MGSVPIYFYFEQRGDVIWLRVRVQPKASRNAIILEEDGRIRVALTAPPVDGEANKSLCAFLAKELGVAKGNVRVVKGEKSREKVVEVKGVVMDKVMKNFNTEAQRRENKPRG